MEANRHLHLVSHTFWSVAGITISQTRACTSSTDSFRADEPISFRELTDLRQVIFPDLLMILRRALFDAIPGSADTGHAGVVRHVENHGDDPASVP